MNLKLAQLETFYWIARLGTFHAAARKLNFTQPTLSARIRELEAALDVCLFQREGRLVRLTAAGNSLFPHAESIVVVAEQIENNVGRRVPVHGLLQLGVPDSFAIVCLPRLLEELEAEQPGLEIEVTVDASASLARHLSEGNLDLAIFMSVEPGSEMRVERLGKLSQMWVANASFEMPKRTLRPEDLCIYRIITNPYPALLYGTVMEWFGDAGLRPSRLVTCNNLSAIARLVAGGVGIGLLPVPMIQRELREGELAALSVHPPVPQCSVFAGHPPKRKFSVASSTIIDKARTLLIDTNFLG